jgi:predicted NBD/HSP70 family sugar kinase
VEGELTSNGVGRPSRPVAFNPAGQVALGIEINVDYVAACVLDLTGRLRSHRQLDVDNREATPAEVYARAARLSQQVHRETGQPLLGVGLAVPGVVDARGKLLRAPNLPLMTGELPGVQIARLLGTSSVPVENEANLGALASLWSTPTIGQDFVYVSGEIGVGAALIVDGDLFRGSNGFAGELGHVVVERGGPSCGCGGRGCVEQYAGQEVLLRNARQPDLDALEAAVSAGEARALKAVDTAGSALGVGLASLLNVVDLPLIVLGGLYARLFDEITPALTGELQRRALSYWESGVEIHRSPLGTDATVQGAARGIIDRALKNPTLFAVSRHADDAYQCRPSAR